MPFGNTAALMSVMSSLPRFGSLESQPRSSASMTLSLAFAVSVHIHLDATWQLSPSTIVFDSNHV